MAVFDNNNKKQLINELYDIVGSYGGGASSSRSNVTPLGVLSPSAAEARQHEEQEIRSSLLSRDSAITPDALQMLTEFEYEVRVITREHPIRQISVS
jgi:hypothetical protein